MSIYRLQNNNELLKYLDNEELEQIAEARKVEKYRDGETCMKFGDRNRDIFVTRKGTVDVLVEDGEGNEIKIATLGVNQIVGEVNFIVPIRRSATVRAIGDVEIIRYPYKELTGFLRKNPLIAAKIFASINDGLSEKVMRTIELYLKQTVCHK